MSESLETRRRAARDSSRHIDAFGQHREAVTEGIREHLADPTRHAPGLCGHYGRSVSAETRAKNASAVRRNTAAGKYRGQAEAAARNHAAGVYRHGPTSLERKLYALLEGAGFQVEYQVRFGRYVVDAWLPQERLVFEADGAFWFWHQDAEREARRDAYLTAHGVAAVVHLTDEDLM